MENKLRNDLKEAMKNKDILKRNTIKGILDRAQNIAKESKSDISDEIINRSLNKELKVLNSIITELDKLKQTDSDYYKETKNRISIVESYMPRFLTEDEIVSYVNEFIEEAIETNVVTDIYKEKGKVIGFVMKKFNTMPVDKKLVNSLVQAKLKED